MKWHDVKQGLLADPGVAREYDALKMEHELARSIIQRRLEKGLSQRQLAERADTKQPVISRLESGNSTPSLSLLQRVARALDADVVVRIEEQSAPRKTRRVRRGAAATRVR